MGKPDLQDGIMHQDGSLQTGFPQAPHARPRPGRRRNTRLYLLFDFPSVLNIAFLLLVLLSYSGTSNAADMEAPLPRAQKFGARINHEEIIFDTRPAPQPALYRRAEASSIVAPPASKTKNAAVASSNTSETSTASIESAPTDSPSPLPKPFDGGLGTNYTQPSCPTFLKSMISNDTFTSCMPFSLLLQVT